LTGKAPYKFEAGFLQRRVCETSVPQRRERITRWLGGSLADLTATRFRSAALKGAFTVVGAVGDPKDAVAP
jgi:hypothetical protein